MAHPMSIAQRYEAGDVWLADCHTHPALVWKAWHAGTLAEIESGAHWLIAESTVSQGLPAAARVREEQRGPVLMDPYANVAWWLVPLDASEELADVRQLHVRHAGWTLRCPPAGRERERMQWLWDPDGTGHLTEPAVLAAAFRPGVYRGSTETPA